VLLCDVDHFKQVNDRNGHRFGDLVLMQIGKALGDVGYACRFGGDEFALWLECDAKKATAQAERLLVALRNASGDKGQPVGLSIGVVPARPGTDDVDDLVHRADIALYAVKAAGGAAVRIAA
jgi:diguanylate cyclase (GGDEF)-like protein